MPKSDILTLSSIACFVLAAVCSIAEIFIPHRLFWPLTIILIILVLGTLLFNWLAVSARLDETRREQARKTLL